MEPGIRGGRMIWAILQAARHDVNLKTGLKWHQLTERK
jgi:hypothetical protein